VTEYIFSVSTRQVRDPRISAEARYLLILIRSYANGDTLETYVSPLTLQRVAGIGEHKRQKLQAELMRAGYLECSQTIGKHGRRGRMLYTLKSNIKAARSNLELGENTDKERLFDHFRSKDAVKQRVSAVPQFHRHGDTVAPNTSENPICSNLSAASGNQGKMNHQVFIAGARAPMSLSPVQRHGDDLNPSPFERKPNVSPKHQRWREQRILGRAKTTVTNRGAFVRASLEKFVTNEAQEIVAWLRDRATDWFCRLGYTNIGDLSEELKGAAASFDLPYDADTIDSAIEAARLKWIEQESARQERQVGTGPSTGRGPVV
jgi:hypothetical protein